MFLCGSVAVLTGPVVAQAQPSVKVHQIGFLPSRASAAHRQQLVALREGLRELGYVPDKTIIITAVWPETPSELPIGRRFRPVRTTSRPSALPPRPPQTRTIPPHAEAASTTEGVGRAQSWLVARFPADSFPMWK